MGARTWGKRWPACPGVAPAGSLCSPQPLSPVVPPRLRLFQKFSTFRILVCGGDGSVGWVLSEIDALGLHKQVSRSAWRCRHRLALSPVPAPTAARSSTTCPRVLRAMGTVG